MKQIYIFRLSLVLGQLMLLLLNQQWQFWPQISHYLVLACLTYLLAINWIFWFKRQWQQSPYMILMDLLLWAAFFAFLDGVSNPLIWCLLLPTVLSSLSQKPVFTWFITVLSNLVYMWLWSLGVHVSSHGHHGAMMANHINGMWLGFVVISLLLTWVTTTLMNRIRKQNKAMIAIEQQRQADENLIKMATLATSMAHELGTPLASIKLLVDDIVLSVNDDAIKKDLSLLESQVSRCKKVLQELTAVTDRSRFESFNVMTVKDYIDQLLSDYHETKWSVDVKNNIQNEPKIQVDESLKLACLNVLNNAKSAGSHELQITLEHSGNEVTVIFYARSEQHSRYQSGLGIGLKLSKRIIESMGGTLYFEKQNHRAVTTINIPQYHG